MKSQLATLIAVAALCAPTTIAQLASPGLPEENGLAPKSETVYINLPDTINNGSTESTGVGIAANGNVIIGWEDDGDGLIDQEAVWTLFSPSGSSLTPDMNITSLSPDFAGETLTTKYLSYFRADGTPISGWTSWGPKIKANLFGDGIGMGATSFALGVEVAELADLNVDAGGGGDFPAVQLLTNDGEPIRIVTGLSDADAEPEGDVRIADWDYLSNGNIVIVGESRQENDLVDRFGGAAPDRHAVYRIVDPEGNEIKELSLVSESSDARVEMWHGVGVVRGGFGLRFGFGGRATVRLFDNDGNPTTGNIDIGTLTENEATAGGGRGDGAGFHGNGENAYLIVNAGNDDQGAPQVWATVLNADGTLRYSQATTDDWPLNGPGRVDGAIDATGRVIVVFADTSGTFGDVKVIMGRLFDAAGTPLGSTSFISEKEDDFTAFAESRRPRIAWRNGFAVVIWESRNSPETAERVVAFRMFGTLEPGTIESVGLTRIVPDTPIITPEADALGNWEPYASVLGTSTFLIEGNTFAEGSVSEQRFVVALQPVDGSSMKTVEGFYDDSGNPYSGQINFSRQNGNPGRVAGDKRPGAVNYMVGAEASPHVLTEFNSDGRWDLGFDRGGDGRYGTVQAYALDTASLTPTPTSPAIDAVNGRLDFGGTGGGQMGRFGGDMVALDNGNFAVVVEDRAGALDPATSATAVIIAPDGSIVVESFLIETQSIWSNVAAYKGGFAVRVHQNIYFYNNNGELQGMINQDTSGESFDTGRGDGTRISAHINSPFLYLAGKVTGSTTVKLAVWDSRDQSFVTVGDVSEPAFAGDFDRVNLAVDALDRVTVAWDSQPAGYGAVQVAARVLAFDGSSITAMTASFLPFVNAAKEGGIRTTRMSVAMTTREIMIAAKGEINLDNNPAAGANSPAEINFYTVISHPDPMDDPTTPVGGGGGDLSITDGLVAHWPLNEGSGDVFKDVVGGFDGFLPLGENGAQTEVRWSAGPPTQPNSVEFLGANSFIATAFPGIGGGNPRTVAFWVRTTDENSAFVAWGLNETARKWHIRGNGADGMARTEYAGGQNFATTSVIDGEWHHIASVFPNGATEGEEILHYLDGVLDPRTGGTTQPIDTAIVTDANIDWTDANSTEPYPVHIGGRLAHGWGNMLAGSMADIGIWNRALTEDEIVQLTSGSIPVGGGGQQYEDPAGGWLASLNGDEVMVGADGSGFTSLDGTWSHDNGSDQWDGSEIGGELGDGNRPGGVMSINGYLRFQETGDPRDHGFSDAGSNRKLYFGKDLTAEGVSNTVLDDGVTLYFRVRVPTDGPLDDIYPDGGGASEPYPAEGDGYVLHNGGKSTIGIKQANGGVISFALATLSDLDGAGAGLVMNNLNGTSITGDVDPGDAGTLNLIALDPTQWHEFWITIAADTALEGTHQVDVYVDGATVPETFKVTAGDGSDFDGITYLTVGLGATGLSGAIDVDFLHYQTGAIAPAGGGAGINTDGLVAYWSFDGDLSDSVGSLDGTAQGSVGFEAGQAGFGQAISLDGSSFVEITDSSGLEFPGGSMSIAGWFTVGSFDKSWQALISKGEGTNYRVARRGGENSIAYAGGVGEGTNDAPDVNDGGWHHFVAVSDASAAEFGTALYVDGVMYEVNATAPVLDSDTTNLYIGENPEALNRQWIGLIDDISIWSRVLNSDEVSALYAGGTGLALSTVVGGGGAIGIVRSATGVTVTFEGTLQSSDSVTGPYTDVAGATSPAEIPLSGSAQFFRSQQ